MAEDQVSEPNGKSNCEEDESGMRTNQKVNFISCLGSIPRHHIWGVLLSSGPQKSVYECNSNWLSEKGVSPQAARTSLHLARNGERPGVRGSSCWYHRLQLSLHLPVVSSSGQMRVILCAFDGWPI